MIIHRFPPELYKQELLKLIRGGEGFQPRIYPDRGGVPTIGFGYALLTKRKGVFIPRPGWETDFQKAGIYLSDWEEERLERLLENIADGPITKERSQRLIEEYYREGGVEITEEQGINLFFVSVEWYQNFVRRKIGEQVYRYYDSSRELIPLVSLAYNRPALFNNRDLVTAIKNFDRVRTYLEIVYRSNPDWNLGIATRRKREGDYFQIWDRKSPSIEEAVHFFEIYNQVVVGGKPYYEYIREYEEAFAPVFGLSPGAVAYRGPSILAFADQAFGEILAYYNLDKNLYARRGEYYYPISIDRNRLRIG
ncbi:MAG: hypothetical protein ABGW77_00755 [Campylobacterales bacterium]